MTTGARGTTLLKPRASSGCGLREPGGLGQWVGPPNRAPSGAPISNVFFRELATASGGLGVLAAIVAWGSTIGVWSVSASTCYACLLAGAAGGHLMTQPGPRPAPSITVRLYSAMTCDLYHFGHASVLQRGADALKRRLSRERPGVNVRVEVVVGICSDSTVAGYKRQPILPLVFRAAAMRSCKYCDVVLEDVPAITDADFMAKHAIDYILTGDDYTASSLRTWFPAAVQWDRCITVPYTRGISTSDIIRRCQDATPVRASMIHDDAALTGSRAAAWSENGPLQLDETPASLARFNALSNELADTSSRLETAMAKVSELQAAARQKGNCAPNHADEDTPAESTCRTTVGRAEADV